VTHTANGTFFNVLLWHSIDVLRKDLDPGNWSELDSSDVGQAQHKVL
jgi:hypothetical protein